MRLCQEHGPTRILAGIFEILSKFYLNFLCNFGQMLVKHTTNACSDRGALGNISISEFSTEHHEDAAQMLILNDTDSL